MKEMLCSKLYQDFFNNLPDESVSIDTLMQHIDRTVPPLLQQICVARLEISIEAPKTAYDVHGKSNHTTLYSEETYGEHPLSKEYITGENGRIHFLAYPPKDYEWSVAEEEQILFLLKNLYFISGRTRIMEIIGRMAVTDLMTELPNMTGLRNHCNKLIAQSKFANYTGIFINLKSFKYINQRLGSRVGDSIIRKYAHTVAVLIESDEFFARIGGDNFIALITHDHVHTFLRTIDWIPIKIQHGDSTLSVDITAKAGIYPIKPQDRIEDMLNFSSLAMSEAKESLTENFVWFNQDMLDRSMHNKEITSLFPHALNNQEFVVYYQPKVQLDNDTLYGCEALVRWVRNGSLVPPLDFIPVLEQTGYLCMLDFYVLDRVCQDIRHWQDLGIEPVTTSVNFSKLHLHNRNLAHDILKVLEKHQIDSSYIEIELTESSGYIDFADLKKFVSTMKEYGIRTSLDDFGTGYSSLNLLKDLNVDTVKLDRSFIQNIESDTAHEVVVKALVNMINELDMEVIAEGVENTTQADYLRSIQCHLAQGFLFDQPLPHDEFEKRLTTSRTYTLK